MKANVGFLGLLGLLFIGLKLGGLIQWSWFYVTMPLWGPLGLVLAFLALAGFFVVAIAVVEQAVKAHKARSRE